MREVFEKTEEFKDSPVGRIPKDWEVSSLAGITQYITYGFTNPMPTTKDGPWMITALDIANGIIHYQQARHTSEKAYKNGLTQKSKPQIGDILITKDGTLGRIAVVDRTDICINQSVACLRPLPDTDIKFLVHYLSSGQGQDQMLADAGGSTIKHLYITKIAKMEVPVPPTEERRKIVKILDTVDDAIARTSSLIIKLKQTKAGLLQDLLTRGLDDDGKLRDPQAHPEQFKDSLLGRIPKDWEIRLLSTVAEVNSGVTLGRNISGVGTIELPYLRVANVQDGYLELTDIKTIRVYKEEVTRFLLQPGDVLMNEGGDYDKLGRGTVWNGQIVPCLHQNHVFRVRPNGDYLISEFLALISGSTYGKRFFILSSKQSTNLASINSTQLKSFPIPCPTILEQQRILSVFKLNETRIRAEEAYLNKLKLQKQGLMQDLLTGKVRVKNL